MFSGCQDVQTSADVGNVASFELPADAGPGGAGGACTNAMLATLLKEENKDISWVKLLEGMRQILKEKSFTQVPQLSGSRPLDLGEPFSMAKPSGKKRSLLIGINYVGQQGELHGCHNDVIAMKKYIEDAGYPSDEASMKVLMDDGSHESPTMENIVAAFGWLTEGIEAGDSLFLHYSGHGGSVKDTNNDEADGKDETLIPLDYADKGQLTDDLILANLVLEVPRDAMLTAVIDACHSGTVLDLPYKLVADDTTMQNVSANDPGTLPENTDFDFSKLFKIGKMLWDMHQQGASKQQIAMMAFGELQKSGALGKLGNLSGQMSGLQSQLGKFGIGSAA